MITMVGAAVICFCLGAKSKSSNEDNKQQEIEAQKVELKLAVNEL